jgi:hypothetical protein
MRSPVSSSEGPDYEDGGLGTLNDDEVDTVRFLIASQEWESIMDEDERAGMTKLRLKLERMRW